MAMNQHNPFEVPLGVPVIGGPGPSREEVEAAAVKRIFHGFFQPIFVQLTVLRAAHGYPNEAGLTEAATPERVMDEATAYAHAAMEAMGFVREGEP